MDRNGKGFGEEMPRTTGKSLDIFPFGKKKREKKKKKKVASELLSKLVKKLLREM